MQIVRSFQDPIQKDQTRLEYGLLGCDSVQSATQTRLGWTCCLHLQERRVKNGFCELCSTYPIVPRRTEWKYNNRQSRTHLSQTFNVAVPHLSASQDRIKYLHLYKDSEKLFYNLCYNNYLNIVWIRVTEDGLARPKHEVQSDIKWQSKLSYWRFF
jgi:hypothetical protein